MLNVSFAGGMIGIHGILFGAGFSLLSEGNIIILDGKLTARECYANNYAYPCEGMIGNIKIGA